MNKATALPVVWSRPFPASSRVSELERGCQRKHDKTNSGLRERPDKTGVSHFVLVRERGLGLLPLLPVGVRKTRNGINKL